MEISYLVLQGDETVCLHGFEKIKDILYVHPANNGKAFLILEQIGNHPESTSAFQMDGRKIHSNAFARMVKEKELEMTLFTYIEGQGYFPTDAKV